MDAIFLLQFSEQRSAIAIHLKYQLWLVQFSGNFYNSSPSLCGLNPLPRRAELNENSLLADPCLLVQLNEPACFFNGALFVKRQPAEVLEKVKLHTSIYSYTHLASTSVDTRPGMSFKISTPKLTYILSMAAVTWSFSILQNKHVGNYSSGLVGMC